MFLNLRVKPHSKKSLLYLVYMPGHGTENRRTSSLSQFSGLKQMECMLLMDVCFVAQKKLLVFLKEISSKLILRLKK